MCLRVAPIGLGDPRVRGVGAMQAEQRRPPVEVLAQRVAQGWGVRVGGRHETARFESGQLQHASAGVDRASRLV
ncbi:MAG: hypothetical protein WBQ21_02310 [Solirubrobacteraceae bacterium]